MSDQKDGWFQRLLNTSTSVFLDTFLGVATGPSTTDLLSGVVANVVYDLIKNRWELTEEETDDVRNRAQKASKHLMEASDILSELQGEIDQRTRELKLLLSDISSRRTESEHWQKLASADEELAAAFTKEIERRVRDQLRAELDRNKTRRQLIAVIIWTVTLIAGGVVGAAIQHWWQGGFSL